MYKVIIQKLKLVMFPQHNGHIDEYLHVDILRAVIFYNDDFGIVPGDSMVLRREKFRNWLSEPN